MPDYIYLLENRLSSDQRNALRLLRDAAREAGMILFLTGDAVRDLTSGHAVRELEVAVHGNALKLKKIVEKLGAKVWGVDEAANTLYLCFPGTVRVDVVSTHRAEYPKPGRPVFHPASIQEDLRRRDFTVNAMAISLNEGSFGLLMDPLNGAADIEARSLRLVSNYGFLEEPALLIRAIRYKARLSWDLDPKTHTRYENAVGEGVIESLSAQSRSEELEQIGHEEDGLKVLQALETEGWMKVLFLPWTVAKADEEKLKALHELAVQLLMQGIHADMSAAQMQLLTARLPSKDLSALKKLMLRPGFVDEWNSLDTLASGFAKVLMAKDNQTPSAAFKLFMSYDPEAVLWLGFTSKDAAVQERYNLFLKVWPEARQRLPHALMQEMRITPELPAYNTIVQAIFLQLIDGNLNTPEEIRAFLEPHSPPAPPPQITIKRPRAKRGAEAKIKEAVFDDDEEAEDVLEDSDDLDDIGGDEDEIDLGIPIPKLDLEPDLADADESEAEAAEDDSDEPERPHPAPAKRGGKPAPAPKPAKAPRAATATPSPKKPEIASKPAPPAPKPALPAPKTKPSVPAAPASVKGPVPPVKGKAVPTPPPAKAAPAKPTKAPAPPPPAKKPAAKPPAKAPAKAALKSPAKSPAKAAAKAPPHKSAPAKRKPAPGSKSGKSHPPAKPSKPAAKKPAPKPAKRR
jgi:tRNA nucleotidyltransferase/poly(A) polymerase